MSHPSSFARKLAHLLPVALPLTILLVTGFIGLDFGRHWDEWLLMRSLGTAVEEQTLLPEAYNYPSLSFWLALLSLAPEILADLPVNRFELAELQARLTAFIPGPEFRLRVRGVFLVVSSLAVLWTYLAQLRWRGRVGEALLAATIVGLSFEFAYHARWIAPDAVNVQLTALCMLLLVGAWSSPRPRGWLLTAAAVAGLATGTKYTAGLLLLPVLIGLVGAARAVRQRLPVTDPDAPPPMLAPESPRLVSALPLALLCFFAAFLATTPGAVLEPFSFYRDVSFEARHYGEKGHYGFTIEAGWTHLVAQLRYLGGAALSPFEPVSWTLFGLAALGVVSLVRDSRRLALVLLVFPVLFLAYMSTNVVLFVRNILLVLPFLALFAARGSAALGRLFGERAGPHVPLALALILVGVHGTWLVHAAGTIRERGETPLDPRYLQQLDRFLAARAPAPVWVAPEIAAALEAHAPLPRPNVTHDVRSGAEVAVTLPPAVTHVRENLPSNRPGSILRTFGPREVNLEYYWTWPETKIVVTSLDYALEAGLVPPGTE